MYLATTAKNGDDSDLETLKKFSKRRLCPACYCAM